MNTKKYDNTALIVELLYKQIGNDIIKYKNNKSDAIKILKDYVFNPEKELFKEYYLYKCILDKKSDIETVLEQKKNINKEKCIEEKKDFINKIKKRYGKAFFLNEISNYKLLSSVHLILESKEKFVKPDLLEKCKNTIKEHYESLNKEDKLSSLSKSTLWLVENFIIDEYNERYKNLLPEQKEILRKYIFMGNKVNFKNYLLSVLNKNEKEIKKLIENDENKKQELKPCFEIYDKIKKYNNVNNDFIKIVMQSINIKNELRKKEFNN